MLFYFTGFIIFFTGSLSALSNPLIANEKIYFFSLLTVYALLCTLIWFLPIIMVKIWLQDFKLKCGNTSKNYFEDCRNCFNLYSTYEEVFKNLFITFFGSSQILSIVLLFLSFSSFVTHLDISLDELLNFAGLIFTFTGNNRNQI